MQFNFTYLWVDDVEAATRLYCSAFGFEVTHTEKDSSAALLRRGEYRLGIDAKATATVRCSKFGDEDVHSRPAGFYLALDAENADTAHAQALAAGCEEMAAPADYPSGNRVSWLRDPWGAVVELCQFPVRPPAPTRREKLLFLAGATGLVATLPFLIHTSISKTRLAGFEVAYALLLLVAWGAWLGATASAWRDLVHCHRRKLQVLFGLGLASVVGTFGLLL